MTESRASHLKSGAWRLLARFHYNHSMCAAFALLTLGWLGAAIVSANAALASDPVQKPKVASEQPIPTASPDKLGYAITHWTAEHGLPGGAVTSLAQTPDDCLWCGTYSGLARYDGSRFKVFDSASVPALDGLQIVDLCCDSQGRLWIGGSAGELVVYENARFRRITPSDGLPVQPKREEIEDPKDGVRVEDFPDSRFYRYESKRFGPVAYAEVPGSIINRFKTGSDGPKSGLAKIDHPAGWSVSLQPSLRSPASFDNKLESSTGKFFYLGDGDLALASSKGIYALQDSQWMLRLDFGRNFKEPVLAGVQDWNGNFWVSFAGLGLVFCTTNGQMELVHLPELAEHSSVRALMLGAEGNVWAGSDDGLYRIRREAFQRRPGPVEASSKAVSAVLEDSQGMTWGIYSDGLINLSEGRQEYLPNPDAHFQLRTGAPSRDGGLLLGYMNRRGSLGGYVEKVTAIGERELLGVVKNNIHGILERKTGEIWMATDNGIWRLKGKGFVRVPINGVAGSCKVSALAEDREGRLIAGVFHRGLYRQEKQGVWRKLTTTNDLGSDRIISLYVDKQNTLWAATDSGLARWRGGRWYAFSGSGGALPRRICGITADHLGSLWISSRNGVARVNRRLLDAVADGEDVELDSSWFDCSDGLPSAICPAGEYSIHGSTDGRIWVATAGGAAVANPEDWQKWRRNENAPAVRVEAMLVDNKLLVEPSGRSGQAKTAQIVVPPGVHRLEFRYTAISLTANRRTRFRYELEGADKDWINAGGQRTVVYHGLRPGKYRFHVTAANKYGLWNDTGAAVTLLVRPYWWQTLWFRIGGVTLLIGLFWFSRSIKLRQLRRQRVRREEFARRLMESQEAERQRVARELHDGLGQDLMLIKNTAQMTLRRVSEESPAREQLTAVSTLASRAIKDARAIMCNLRPPELDRLGLTEALEAMMDSVRSSAHANFESKINDIDNLWTPDQEIHVYRIVQECMNNAVKHAQATRIDLLVSRANSSVRIQVSDNGQGFSSDQVLSATGTRGFGLVGMRERVRFLGGRVEFESGPGRGTRVELLLPIPNEKSS